MSGANGSNRRELFELIDGKDDGDILLRANEIGTDELLARVFRGMEEAFRPEMAQGVDAVVQWEIAAGEEERTYQVTVGGGGCAIESGAAHIATVILRIALPDFLRVAAGRLGAIDAFLDGKLGVAGDPVFAATIPDWFADG